MDNNFDDLLNGSDSFFGSFEDLEEELGLADTAADTDKSAQAPSAQAADTAAEGASATAGTDDFDFFDDDSDLFNEDGSITFVEDTKKEIEAMLAGITKPESGLNGLEKPSDDTASISALSSLGESGRSVFYAPEAGKGFDVDDLPSYVLGDDDDLFNDLFPGGEESAAPAHAALPVQPEVTDESKESRRKAAAAGKKKNSGTGEAIRKTVFVLAIITIVVSLGVLGKLYLLDPYLSNTTDQKAANELIEEKELPSGTTESKQWQKLKKEFPDIEFAPDMQLKYARLYAANPDLAGWINIDAFGINMPLAQGEDNDYYLKRNIYKKSTTYGVPFIDYRNDLYFLDRNTIVFGHNMRYSDKIFGMLEDYKTIDGFKRAPVIQCNTIYDDYTWKVYAVFITNSEPVDDNGYVFNYTFTRLKNDKFMKYIEEVDERALYKTGVDICETDQILTLSTCCYDFDSAKLVVIARLLRDGESAEVDTSLAVMNPNPRYPQAWYDANEKSNPYANAGKWFA